MAQITYTNKVALNENPSIADINKVNASDMNEIKNVVNSNASTMDNMIVNQYSNSTTNTYSCDYVNNLTEVLWTNSSPNTDFSGQTITLSSSMSNYSYYEIIAKYSTTTEHTMANYYSTGKIPANQLARIIDISGGVPNFRNVLSISGTSMQFDDCKYYTAYLSTTMSNYNSSCVPVMVLGHK